MLSQPHRLPGYQIPLLYQRGRRVRVGGLQFIYQKIDPHSPSQFTVIAPVRVAKKAVVRNRLKRVARAAIRSFLPDLPTGILGILEIRDLRLGESAEVMKQSLREVFVKASLHSQEIASSSDVRRSPRNDKLK